TALLSGALLAFISYPIYKYTKKFIKNDGLRASLLTLVIFLVLTLPLIYVVSNVTRESIFRQTNQLYLTAKQKVFSGNILNLDCEGQKSFACDLNENINAALDNPDARQYLANIIGDALTLFSKSISDILLSIPKLFISIIITVLAVFYFLRDGKTSIDRIQLLLPLKKHHQIELFTKLYDIAYAVLYGTLLVALLQGVYAAIGFAVFGFSNTFIIGAFIFFFALLPLIGAWVVWVPIVLFHILSSYVSGEVAIIKWILLVLFGFSISTIDNLIRPFVIGGKARMNALLIFLGVLGGLLMFGIFGFVFGPIVLGLAKVLLEIYEEEKTCAK
ncbi:AI-2E family transporter, partial [Candidatus Woesearchaeota archaeon]|nr:AI-2E family transporter [Candidatus Woesearchaeota archaeon]